MAGNIQRKLTIGINPLSYLGVNAESPPNSVLLQNQDPTTSNWQNFIVGDIWINENGSPTPPNPRIWILGALQKNLATWILIASGAGGDVNTLTGNSGGAVSPLLGNINVVGDGTTINIVGNPGTHTLTVSAIGTGLVSSFLTDNGTATPIAGVVDIFSKATSGSSTSFSASTNIIRLNVTDTLTNTLIGNGAGNGTLTGNSNVGLGASVLHALTSGSSNTALGTFTGIAITSGSDNSLFGGAAGGGITTGSGNSIYGTSSAGVLTTGSNNTALGLSVFNGGGGAGLLTGSNNIGIGMSAGTAYVGAESSNILIGNIGIAAESNQIKIGTFGSGAGQQNATFLYGGTVNVPNGNVNVPTTTSTTGAYNINGTTFVHNFGTANTFLGSSAGNLTNTGISNVGIGTTSMFLVTTGTDNVFVGWGSALHVTSASNNVGIGSGVLNGPNPPGTAGLLTGQHNIAIGHQAGSAYAGAESSNIIIGSSLTGTVTENNTCRIGNGTGTGATQLNQCFIAGIAGITTAVADAVTVLISASTGQLGTVSSSRKYKKNIKDMADQSEIIYDLKPKTFNFKKHPDIPAWGLIAEEVETVFPQLVVYKDDEVESIKYHELVPLMLNEIIKLNKRIEALENLSLGEGDSCA